MFIAGQKLQYKGDALYAAREVTFLRYEEDDGETLAWVHYPDAALIAGADPNVAGADEIQVFLEELS
jgi:hypothetical protein